MKKLVILPFLTALTLILTACVGGEFIGLSIFIERWNSCSENSLDYSDFVIEQGESENSYSIISDGTAIKLTADENENLKQCKIIITKKDEEGKDKSILQETSNDFFELCKKSVMAYCGFDETATIALLNEFTLNDLNSLISEGELSKNQNEYNFVYYSTQIASEFIITNTLLVEIESTLKPESKIAFADTTHTRVETVPHE